MKNWSEKLLVMNGRKPHYEGIEIKLTTPQINTPPILVNKSFPGTNASYLFTWWLIITIIYRR